MQAVDSVAPSRLDFFASLDSLRGVAAFLVALHHLPPWSDGFYRLPLIRHGYLMVNLFFVLSGFVLFHSYGHRLQRPSELVDFGRLRLGRLYPVHLAFLTPFVVIEALKLASHLVAQGAELPAYRLAKSILANLLLLQGVGLVNVDPMLNFPSWSISTEFYTYLLFALAMVFVPRPWFARVASIVVLVCVLSLFLIDLGSYAKMVRCIAGFFFGCVTRVGLGVLRNRPLRHGAALAATLSLLALVAPWTESRAVADSWEQLSLPISGLLLVSLVAWPSSIISRALLLQPLRWLGLVSYSLYMSHALVQWLARQLCRVVLRRPDQVVDGVTTVRLTPLEAAVAYPVTVVAMLLVAGVSYRLIEAPARDAVRNYVRRHSRAPLAIGSATG
jgi:peptidoglycan/LPS O-acetylase OafA/YrhL